MRFYQIKTCTHTLSYLSGKIEAKTYSTFMIIIQFNDIAFSSCFHYDILMQSVVLRVEYGL